MQGNVPFDKRLKRIVRRHEKMSNGVVRTVTSDGLIVAKPRLYKPRFPLKGLIAVLLLGFLFKGFLFAFLGEAAYVDRVASLQSGTLMEQVGAWVMQPDPVTFIAAQGITLILPQQ
ncbi:MAG: hypothetical protein NWQ23_08000 [Yoonia sp.]|jgi:hypothetical protein|uniref:hypothetical protein n=1 Tax=Yoonia sp. TaxID=2212373 RepID=UPI00273EE6F9|nr:hypothetical protein [Yoonia sp.]MDP5085348.1 hypothetical protein [Yoonia sp.]